jgi:glycine oxidase
MIHDVIVIGGGVIGLSIARELAGRKSVLLLDRGPTGQGTSRAAAGMLSPLSEADDQGPFFQLGRASHLLYDRFVAEVQAESGVYIDYSTEGLLFLATTEESANALQRRYEWQKNAGFELELVSADAVRRMEPLVTLDVRTALFIPGDRSVSPRQLVNALKEASLKRGVEVRTGVRVQSISQNRVHIGETTLEAQNIIVASGVWSAELSGLKPPIPVYPRKGEILALQMPDNAFRHMIRWGSSYFVPRGSGELVVGATNEDAGFSMSNTPAGLGHLLMDAQQISSHVGAYPILETWTGLRPATPDQLPILGPSTIPGVYYATGHYRNGVLLAPITAAIVSDLLEGRKPRLPIEVYAPSRFGSRHV